jgi:hypothetical protein
VRASPRCGSLGVEREPESCPNCQTSPLVFSIETAVLSRVTRLAYIDAEGRKVPLSRAEARRLRRAAS